MIRATNPYFQWHEGNRVWKLISSRVYDKVWLVLRAKNWGGRVAWDLSWSRGGEKHKWETNDDDGGVCRLGQNLNFCHFFWLPLGIMKSRFGGKSKYSPIRKIIEKSLENMGKVDERFGGAKVTWDLRNCWTYIDALQNQPTRLNVIQYRYENW